MAGGYGVSFASKSIAAGHYEQAVAEATLAIEREASDPEAWFERATAYAWMDRYPEAVSDFERALALDAEAGVLDTDAVDDATFSALLGAARQEPSADDGVKRLQHYAAILPRGRHIQDAIDWSRRLRGELRSEFVKHPEEPGRP